MRTLSASIVLLAAATMPVKADRPVTEAERAKLEAAVAAQGCSGGKMEWDDDDREFEVDDVRCNDGKKYELKFNADYTLKSKELDD
jgi:Peptidase propeptide and YPEB domain